MPTWFDHVEAAAEVAGVDPSYVFVVPSGDETIPVLMARAHSYRMVLTDEAEPFEGRGWHLQERVRHMVGLRNQMLATVREDEPEVFLSLDSDVLLAPAALADLLESLAGYDAVGGGTFMTPPEQGPPNLNVRGRGEQFPSCGWVRGQDGLHRRWMEHRGVIPVGVIMAVKAMGPAAYAIDYRFSRDGEDVGWSVAAGQAGLRLGWDNRHPSKHVINPADLDRVDERCGF